MKRRWRQGSWKPQSVIPLSTQIDESAAAEAPTELGAPSTAWRPTHTHSHTLGWCVGYVHTLIKLPDLLGFVLVISLQVASRGSSSVSQPKSQEEKTKVNAHSASVPAKEVDQNNNGPFDKKAGGEPETS